MLYRIGLGGVPIVDRPGALLSPGDDNKGAPMAADVTDDPNHVVKAEDTSSIRNGNIAATVSASGLVTISRVSDGTTILQELFRNTTSQVGTTENVMIL